MPTRAYYSTEPEPEIIYPDRVVVNSNITATEKTNENGETYTEWSADAESMTIPAYIARLKDDFKQSLVEIDQAMFELDAEAV